MSPTATREAAQPRMLPGPEAGAERQELRSATDGGKVQGIECEPGWSARSGWSRSKQSPGGHRGAGLCVASCIRVPRQLLASQNQAQGYTLCPEGCTEEQEGREQPYSAVLNL